MKDGKTIAILNHKGGVGKTTITFNFGAELAKKGYKVLLIDFDSQANLTKSTCENPRFKETIAEAIAEVINGNFEALDPQKYINKTSISENLDIIPSDIRLADAQEALNNAVAREQILKILIDEIKAMEVYDYILIDNAPSVRIDFQNACVASDEILIVTEPREFSTDGMDSLIFNTEKVRKFLKPALAIKGILINKADMRTNMTKAMIDFIREKYSQYNVYETVVPHSVKVAESQFLVKSLCDYDKNNAASEAIMKFTDEYLI